MELSKTNITFIVTTNAAFAQFLCLFLGPLLNRLGYRKVAIFGALCITLGVTSTAFGNSFAYFLIFYGFITAIGRGVGLSAYPLALNTYFLKDRTRAVGYTLGFAAYGPVIMPQVYNFLLNLYGVKGAVLISGALIGHTFVSSVLLQPIKRHMKKEIIEDITEGTEAERLLNAENGENKARNISKNTANAEDNTIEDVPETKENISELPNEIIENSAPIISNESTTTHLNATDIPIRYDVENSSIILERKQLEEIMEEGKSENITDAKKSTNWSLKNIGKGCVKIFDLTLLKDLTYVNIAIGLSLSFFAEQTFSLLLPFIVQDKGFSTSEIATFMSVLSSMDIVFKYLSPKIKDIFQQPPRIMFMWSLLLPISSKFSLLYVNSYWTLMLCGMFLGAAKGLRIVYFQLVVPDYLPIDRLATAIGLQSAFCCIFICIGGPFVGFITDITGSFTGCIHVINIVTCLTILTWSIELLYKRIKQRKKSKDIVNVD